MHRQIIIAFFFMTSFSFAVMAQEKLLPLSVNPDVINVTIQNKINTKGSLDKAIELPFVDDFTYNSYTPKQDLWSNAYTYVNQRFGINEPTFGVLTFDAFNDSGKVYSYASQFAFLADSLTSKPIRLDSVLGNNAAILNASDSIYFSFWFQPQGVGNAPESEDSLILHFFNPNSGNWDLVWEHEGMSLDSFRNQYGNDFVKVMIPILNADYFSPNFRFRFTNLASIPNNTVPSWRSGMYDHWNIDYVFIDKDRRYNDVSVNDIAFIKSIPTLLKNYISMPWNQYKVNASAETNDTISIVFRNFYTGLGDKNLNQYFSIQNLFDKTFTYSFPFTSTFNMPPGSTSIYHPNFVPFVFQSASTDYADFEVLFRLLTNTPPNDIIRTNDSMRFYQRFYNYYAYDDGTAEAGYGLSNVGARLAYQFTLNQGDSLQAIQFYFNQTLGNANQQYFYLTIWDDNNGQPGNVIYEQSGVRPEFENQLFKFHTYVLDNPLFMVGKFYVGWRQTTVDNLNVGFDLNNDHHTKIFYNTGGTWVNSSFLGSPMIRPILGTKKQAIVALDPISNIASPKINIFPNPSEKDEAINIEISSTTDIYEESYMLKVFDVAGRLVVEKVISKQAKINNLESGLYLLQISSKNGRIITNRKIIIQ